MTKTIKKDREIILALGIGLVLAIAGTVGMRNTIPLINPASAATETMAISATIQQWLTFSASTTTIPMTPDLVTIAGATNIASTTDITLTSGTNSTNGYSIDVRSVSNAGLCHSGGCGTHNINSGTSTPLVAGTDGYGMQATTTDSDVTIHSNYDYWGNDNVGGITVATKDLADTSSPSTGDETSIKFKAAAANTDPDGTYSDSVYVICLANP